MQCRRELPASLRRSGSVLLKAGRRRACRNSVSTLDTVACDMRFINMAKPRSAASRQLCTVQTAISFGRGPKFWCNRCSCPARGQHSTNTVQPPLSQLNQQQATTHRVAVSTLSVTVTCHRGPGARAAARVRAAAQAAPARFRTLRVWRIIRNSKTAGTAPAVSGGSQTMA